MGQYFSVKTVNFRDSSPSQGILANFETSPYSKVRFGFKTLRPPLSGPLSRIFPRKILSHLG